MIGVAFGVAFLAGSLLVLAAGQPMIARWQARGSLITRGQLAAFLGSFGTLCAAMSGVRLYLASTNLRLMAGAVIVFSFIALYVLLVRRVRVRDQ